MNGVITTSPANNNLQPNNHDLSHGHFIDICGVEKYTDFTTTMWKSTYSSFVSMSTDLSTGMALDRFHSAVKEGSFFRTFYQAYLDGENGDAAHTQPIQDWLCPNNFLQVRHFLHERSENGHMALIVISPQGWTVDCLDSAIRRLDEKKGVFIRLIAGHPGGQFLPHEWMVRQGRFSHSRRH